jgi:hypothetical protein
MEIDERKSARSFRIKESKLKSSQKRICPNENLFQSLKRTT